MKPGTTWLSADGELPVRVKRTIAREKRMVIVFLEIHGIAHRCWLFCGEVLDPLVQKMQQNSKKLANL
jgi:hypothetical protein